MDGQDDLQLVDLLKLGTNGTTVAVVKHGSEVWEYIGYMSIMTQMKLQRHTFPIVSVPPCATLAADDVKAIIAEDYLLNVEALRIHSIEQQQRAFPVELLPESLISASPSPPQHTIKARRNIESLEVTSYDEVPLAQSGDAKTSMAMSRAIGSKSIGTTLQKPFVPGGMSIGSQPSVCENSSAHPSAWDFRVEMETNPVQVVPNSDD